MWAYYDWFKNSFFFCVPSTEFAIKFSFENAYIDQIEDK